MPEQVRARAIIFDMDGVITNTMPDHYRAWKIVYQRVGIHLSKVAVYKREGQKGIESIIELSREYNCPFNKKEAKRLLKTKEELFKKIVKRRFIPGARSFVRRLHKEGFRLALVTGTSLHELKQILPQKLYHLFDVVVSGSDVRNGKPHPEPYLQALKKLNISPKDAVVIENAPYGIQAAKAAGLRCFALQTSLPRAYLKGADKIFKDYRELKKSVIFKKR